MKNIIALLILSIIIS